MGIKERKERQRRSVRDGILRAARDIAAGEGWRSVTIRKIAERIEYSPPVIYEHFESKDDILLALLRQGYAEQLEAMESARSAAEDPEDALLGMGRAYLSFAKSSPDLYQVMYGLGGVSFSTEEAQQRGEKISDAVGEVVEDILRKNGKEAEDVEGKVTLLWSTVHGLVALMMVERLPNGQKELDRLMEQAMNDFLTAWRSD